MRCPEHIHDVDDNAQCLRCARVRGRWEQRRDAPLLTTTPEVIADNDDPALRARVDGLIQAEIDWAPVDMTPPTVDGWLRDEHRGYVTRKLRQIGDELGISDALFPPRPEPEPPVWVRVEQRAAVLRAGRSSRRYRGAHRPNRRDPRQLRVDALERYVDAGADEAARFHRRSLRRPTPPFLHIGEREITVQFYEVPGEPGTPQIGTATLTIMPESGLVLNLAALAGPLAPVYVRDIDPVSMEPSGGSWEPIGYIDPGDPDD